MFPNLSSPIRMLALCIVLFIQAAPLSAQQDLPDYIIAAFGQPPAIPSGQLSADANAAIQTALIAPVTQSVWGNAQVAGLQSLIEADDPRIAWIVSDLMRFAWNAEVNALLGTAANDLLKMPEAAGQDWGAITDHLIAWDVPAYPGYLDHKRAIFTNIIPGWERLFVPGNIDWRHVSWGGVPIDNRAHDRTDDPCNCIPAADNPEVSSAADATWLDDDDIVFGITINGESRAYPRQIMEVREMVNDTLGGRDLGIPYCTLCGAAQAYFTDQLPAGVERPILRTSGLLIRSNKVMYDLSTYSVFDTFRGDAVTGPLAEMGIKLEQATVVTTDWGTWKAQHPDTTVLVERLALGRDFDFRNGRDADGPIFPVGDVDPRLPVHEDVIGVITASGHSVAFQRSKAFTALQQGARITVGNVQLVLDAGGIKAVDETGADLGSHQAFWFAWSQFYPNTILWAG